MRRAAKPKTLYVILIDQAEKLVGNRTLTDELMNIRDPDGSAGLNLFFVFAGTDNVEQLGLTTEHGGFFRRFMDPLQCSSIETTLDAPIIESVPENDIDRIRTVLSELRHNYSGLPIPMFDVERAEKIRSRLRALAEHEPVTWPMLWRAMLGDGIN